jgi:hypothetical protein
MLILFGGSFDLDNNSRRNRYESREELLRLSRTARLCYVKKGEGLSNLSQRGYLFVVLNISSGDPGYSP